MNQAVIVLVAIKKCCYINNYNWYFTWIVLGV